jgi:glutamyl/glutaminyl-tRNA synthetase
VCEKYARQMISAGQAYMDDTDQEKMQVSKVCELSDGWDDNEWVNAS